MITTVTWQYILLNGDTTTGFRVKRRTGGPPPMVNSGIDTPASDNWVSAPAPPQIHYVPDGRDYIFAFWSLSAHDTQSVQTSAQIQTGNTANDSHSGGQWIISAKAYYIWNFGGGGGGFGFGLTNGNLHVYSKDGGGALTKATVDCPARWHTS